MRPQVTKFKIYECKCCGCTVVHHGDTDEIIEPCECAYQLCDGSCWDPNVGAFNPEFEYKGEYIVEETYEGSKTFFQEKSP